MPNRFKWLLLLFEIAAALLFASCPAQLWDAGIPPYAVTTPVYKIAGPDDLCTLGGIFFDFYNKSEKEVIFIETCMNVFDTRTGEIAFSGAGGLTSGAACKIPKSELKNLCISLDEYLWQMQTSSLCVDNFFIKKIKYSDGSIWQDKLGVYANTFTGEA